MFMYYYVFSVPMLFISNLLILFNDSFIFMWMVMEFNLMCFMSILAVTKFSNPEVLMKYFLLQAYNSYVFMFAAILLQFNVYVEIAEILIFISLVSKMGLPPFHTWYVDLMKELNWVLFFLNSSLQKFIPLFIMSSFIKSYMFLFFILIMTTVFSTLSGNIFSSLKKVLAFSSMIQINWMMFMMMFNEKSWMTLFLMYVFLSFNVTLILYIFNINYVYELNVMKQEMFFIYMLNFSIFSTAMIPPFTGFINKLTFFYSMSDFVSMYMMVLLMKFSLWAFYFYVRVIFLNIIFYYSLKNYLHKYIKFTSNFWKVALAMNLLMLFFIIFELM
uniref:NADH dehydrogenase subunit 2 n=1 Tax=Lamennaisia nobilis TaxID=2921199 RepID=UPI001F133A29|nr:NADH dehydrogenase subunit 2 [Lamennaisia nobilis]UML36885.1 NADH dehydrogenase subunit 2 [Lamennaisia sp.]